MGDKPTLYMFTGSGPSMTAALMLEHKGVEHRSVHLMVGPHAFGLLGRRFEAMTVPAMKIGRRRVQGSRAISRALDEIKPQPPLFPADPEHRQAVEHAERRGEEIQDVVRRIVLAAARRDAQVFLTIYRHPRAHMRPAQSMARPLVIWLATAGHGATDFAVQDDLAALPARWRRSTDGSATARSRAPSRTPPTSRSRRASSCCCASRTWRPSSQRAPRPRCPSA